MKDWKRNLAYPMDRAAWWRIVWLGVGSYSGFIGGSLYVNYDSRGLGLLNPLGMIGMVAGALITPGANLMLALYAVTAILYVLGRLPRWTAVLCGVLTCAATVLVVLRWRVG